MNYYIEGNSANADKIKAAFENKGYSDKGFTFDVNDILFFTANNKHINVCPANGWLANIIKTHPDYKELELPIEPKFKVGDKVFFGTLHETIALVLTNEQRYICDTCREILFKEQDRWHLAPKPHYDIANFKPFDKVLVRQNDSCTWGVSFFGRCSGGMFMCCTNIWFEQCIPFNDKTKHLLGTTDMPSEEYINW